MKNKNVHFFVTMARIIIIILSISCVFCIFLISPYKEWDTSLKIVDYDVVDVEKVTLLFLSIVNIAVSPSSSKSHKVFIIHILLVVVCLMQFLWLLTL